MRYKYKIQLEPNTLYEIIWRVFCTPRVNSQAAREGGFLVEGGVTDGYPGNA